MVGGAFLCYEGVEKLAHKFLHSKSEEEAHHAEMVEAVANPAVDLVAYEKDKIKGAIRTDFILSAEIIVISLGTVAAAALPQRIAVLSAIAIVMTVGVYGLVAGIVKLDDVGLWLSQKTGATARAFGRFLLWGTPWLMRALSVLGTLAMFLVGGGIIAHGIAPLAHWLHEIELSWSGLFSSVTAMLVNLGIGLLVGAVVLAVVTLIQRMRKPADGGLRA
jgi:predicted DNA repair protein MutK